MTRRGCSLPANASGVDPRRASILSSRFGQAAPTTSRYIGVQLQKQAAAAADPPHIREHRGVGHHLS
eukprot:SAG25_NODE_193_length_12184_cov_5.527844_21_plen_67_part_00